MTWPNVGRYTDGPAKGRRTVFWRRLSYKVGDAHANRICSLVNCYCYLFRVDPYRIS